MIETADINIELLRRHPLPRHDELTDKDSRGRVFMIAGSELCPGAALLSGTSALRGGAGKVIVGTVDSFALQLGLVAPEFGIVSLPSRNGEPACPEDIFESLLKKSDSVLLGPGMSAKTNAREMVLHLLKTCRPPLVLDAVGIAALAGNFDAVKRRDAPCVITPHAGEMAALLGCSKEEIEADPAQIARDTARKLCVTVVLKGGTTYVAAADGRCWRHDGGVKGLATAGSGDTLAGLLAALLARGADQLSACFWGVAIHAKAGAILSDQLGEIGLLARELPVLFPQIMRNWA